MPGQIRLQLISLYTASLFFLTFAPSVHAQIRFDLPPQPLSQALTTLGSLANLNIYFDATTVDGIQAPALKAQLSADDALSRLLAGTRLRAVRVDENTIRVITATDDAKRAQSQHATPIGAVPRPSTSVHLASAGAEPATSGIGDTRAYDGSRLAASKEIAEVLVTAQKREERLLDTPQSVSVLSGEDLDRMGATQFRDFANTIPGLTFTTNGAGNTQISLRGVTAGRDISSTVGVYLDDVPLGSTSSFANGSQTAAAVGAFDLARVEVLRGPQGTVYGAATMGGLIKYVTKAPSTTEFSSTVRAGTSVTHDGGVNYDVSGALNAPMIADKAAIRISAFESHDGGFIDNATLARQDVNRSNIYGGKIDLLFTPTSALTIRLTGFLQNIFSDGQATADYTATGQPILGSLTQLRRYPENVNAQYRVGAATVNYDFGFATLSSISSYQSESDKVFVDSSPSLLALLKGPPFNRPYSAVGGFEQDDVNKFTEEVRFASNGVHLFDWLLGAMYSHEDANKDQVTDPRDLAGNPAPNDILTLMIPSIYKDYALFGDLTYHLNEKWDVTGGLRFARNEQTVTQNALGLFGGSRPTRSAQDDVVTYLANTRYHFNDQTMGYLRFATGYRPGGPNIVLSSVVSGQPLAPATFNADHLKSYEAGFKADTSGHRFGIDMDVYYIDWNDIQITAVRNTIGIRTNAPAANVKGVELTLTARPVSDLTLSGVAAYTNAHLSQAAPDLGGAEGERLPNVPRFSGGLNLDYVMGSGSVLPTFGASVRYISDRMVSFNQSTSVPQYRLPAYTTVDLRAGITVHSIDVQLYAHNLLDARGQLSEFTLGTDRQVAIQQPRTIGITATARF